MKDKSLKERFFMFLTNITVLRRIYRKIVPGSIRNRIIVFMLGYVKIFVRLKRALVNYFDVKQKRSEFEEELLKFLKSSRRSMASLDFLKFWLDKTSFNETVYNFNGAIVPDEFTYDELSALLIWGDTFLFPTLLNDDYQKKIVQQFEPYMSEGPYGYIDGKFDVSIKTGDVVIDAGAWIGDFSAYSASKGAICYAFEPITSNYNLLIKTAELNCNKINPVKKGLGEKDAEIPMFAAGTSSSVLKKRKGEEDLSFFYPTETIQITSLDKFVEENNILKIDFIKADIEGAERDMLKGAKRVLKEFAPKLAICTYHLPDDPQVLKDLILEANPNYTIVQLRKKLYACVVR